MDTNLTKAALVKQSEINGSSIAECLADLVSEVLLSDDDDPIHVYAPDFVKLIDKSIIATME